MSTETNGNTGPSGPVHRDSFTPRVQTAAGPRQPRDLVDATDQDLAAGLRALRAEMPRRPTGSVFPDLVRARARRHRSRARLVAVAALVLVITAGVGIPVSLRAGGG